MKTLIFSAIVLTLTTACGTPGSRHSQTYRLDDGLKLNSNIHKTLVVGLGPIDLPDALNRPQLIQRDEAGRLLIHHGHRWEKPVEETFEQALAENLHRLHPNWKLTFHPWYRQAGVEVQVSVEVQRFDALVDQRVLLEGNLILSTGANTHESGFSWEKKTSNLEMTDQVKVMRELVSALANEISSFVLQHSGPSRLPAAISVGERSP